MKIQGFAFAVNHAYRTNSIRCKSSLNRVVITGLGLITPLGVGVEENWRNLINGISGVRCLDGDEYQTLPCKIAAQIPKESIRLDDVISKGEARNMSLASQYTLIAAQEALNSAKWLPKTDDEQIKTGVAIGTGMCDIIDIYQAGCLLNEKGYKKVSPHFVTRILNNMPAGNVSIKYRLRGPNHSVSTACATGLHAIGDAFNFIKHGSAKVMLCGGTEAPLSALSIAAFSRIRALCTNFNDQPHLASRPFDSDRSGFVMGEGSGLVVLEQLEHALSRKASIYGEVLGYGLSGDAHHITAPDENGDGAFRCMKAAIEDAGISYKDIGHINCHATSTPLGDAIEVKAIRNLFKEHSEQIEIVSTKGSIGHLLGASGSVEAIYAILSCHHRQIPPNLNLQNSLDKKLKISVNSREWCSERKFIALTNSFGFGGTNASLVISRFEL